MAHLYNHNHVCRNLEDRRGTAQAQLGYQIHETQHINQGRGHQLVLQICQDLLAGNSHLPPPSTIITEAGTRFPYFNFAQTMGEAAAQLEESYMLLGGQGQIEVTPGWRLQDDFLFSLHYQTGNIASMPPTIIDQVRHRALHRRLGLVFIEYQRTVNAEDLTLVRRAQAFLLWLAGSCLVCELRAQQGHRVNITAQNVEQILVNAVRGVPPRNNVPDGYTSILHFVKEALFMFWAWGSTFDPVRMLDVEWTSTFPLARTIDWEHGEANVQLLMAAGRGFRHFIAQFPRADVNYPHPVFSLRRMVPLLVGERNTYLTGNQDPPTLAKAADADGFVNAEEPVPQEHSDESEDSGYVSENNQQLQLYQGLEIFEQEDMDEEFEEVVEHQSPARSQSPVQTDEQLSQHTSPTRSPSDSGFSSSTSEQPTTEQTTQQHTPRPGPNNGSPKN